jgi:hypothetical protein
MSAFTSAELRAADSVGSHRAFWSGVLDQRGISAGMRSGPLLAFIASPPSSVYIAQRLAVRPADFCQRSKCAARCAFSSAPQQGCIFLLARRTAKLG